ncbi:hypothetical protein [uncultured Varibaculum sp.]|uniref:hypothetical protein n=1 Tax=uncultured Varibaculum sp. TaxID=413896 RepID=UPI00258E2184|nr:hypothetical protein [uncultured Varibaculum sp.]
MQRFLCCGRFGVCLLLGFFGGSYLVFGCLQLPRIGGRIIRDCFICFRLCLLGFGYGFTRSFCGALGSRFLLIGFFKQAGCITCRLRALFLRFR